MTALARWAAVLGDRHDVGPVDIGLGAIFGNLLGNNSNVTPGLTTDNLAANDEAFDTTFPYLAAPH